MAEIAYISCVSESKQLYLFTNCGRWQIVYTNLWPAFGLHSPAQSDKYFQINAWSAQTIRDRILEPSYSSGEHGGQEGESRGGRRNRPSASARVTSRRPVALCACPQGFYPSATTCTRKVSARGPSPALGCRDLLCSFRHCAF